MLEMSTGIVSIVYDGSLNPLITAYNVGGLTTGSQYAFYVQSIDFNGVSLSSDESVFVVCLAPYHIDSPDFVAATRTSITVSWTKPAFTGGCPILSFTLLMRGPKDTQFHPVDESIIQNRPYLTQYTVSSLSELGGFYDYQIKVTNAIGSITSLSKQMQLAAVPDAPAAAPT